MLGGKGENLGLPEKGLSDQVDFYHKDITKS